MKDQKIPAKATRLNDTQKAIIAAFEAYSVGSSSVIRAFEQSVFNYWSVDSCDTKNLTFFLNTAKRFPKLQKAAKDLLVDFGKFKIKAVKYGTATGYTVENKEVYTKAEKLAYREKIKLFIASEHRSLLNIKKEKDGKEVTIGFDAAATEKKLYDFVQRQLVAMLEADPTLQPSTLKELISKAVDDNLSAGGVAIARKKISDKKKNK